MAQETWRAPEQQERRKPLNHSRHRDLTFKVKCTIQQQDYLPSSTERKNTEK